MVLESTVICVDNSEYMRNGDFLPTRIQAQQDAVNLVCRAKARQNPENSVGLMTLSSLEVLVTLTTDVGKVLSTLHSVKPKGAINIITGIKIAHLALKHRQSKNHRMRIVAFVASPLVNDEKELVKLAKRLKKEKVNVDIVNFGEEDTNTANLETFIKTVNGKDGTSSHLVTVASGSGPILADALVSSAIIDGGEEGSAPASSDGLFDPANDPELALALRVSLEEERQRQEEGNKNTDAQGTAPSEEIPDSEEALLQQALRMSGAVSDTSVGSTPFPDDVSMMSEADQIEYAIKMSLQQHDTASDAETPNIDSSREATPMNTDITNMEADNQDFSEEMADPEFLRNVLGSLPNVDPDSEAVKAAIGQTTQQSSSKSDSKKKDEPMDEDSEKK